MSKLTKQLHGPLASIHREAALIRAVYLANHTPLGWFLTDEELIELIERRGARNVVHH